MRGEPARAAAARLIACRVMLGLAAALMAAPGAQAQPTDAGIPQPVRITTLAPHATELVYAAGAGDKIVSTVLSSDYPPTARAIPRVGNGLEVSVEKVLSFRPTVVIGWQSQGAAQTLGPALARLDIPLILSRPRTLDEIPAEILRFGELFNTREQARASAQALTRRLDALTRRHTGQKQVSVFIEVGDSPLYTIGSDPLLNDALKRCGGVNLYADAGIAAPQVSVESILLRNPDVLIAPARNAAARASIRKYWSDLQLPAALQGRVYTLDPDMLFRPGPRLIDATEELCDMLDQAR